MKPFKILKSVFASKTPRPEAPGTSQNSSQQPGPPRVPTALTATSQAVSPLVGAVQVTPPSAAAVLKPPPAEHALEEPIPLPEGDPPKQLIDLPTSVLQKLGGYLTHGERSKAAETSKYINFALTERADDPVVNRVYQAQTRLRMLENVGAAREDINIAHVDVSNAQRLLVLRNYLQVGVSRLEGHVQYTTNSRSWLQDTSVYRCAVNVMIVFGKYSEAEHFIKLALPKVVEADLYTATWLAQRLVSLQNELFKFDEALETCDKFGVQISPLDKTRCSDLLDDLSKYSDFSGYDIFVGGSNTIAYDMLDRDTPAVREMLASIKFNFMVPGLSSSAGVASATSAPK